MGFRRRLKKVISGSIILTTVLLWGCNECNYQETDNYKLLDYHFSDSCNIYKMIFQEGDYVFRFALSGSCNTLTSKDYIANYYEFLNQPFLHQVFDSLEIDEHILRLEYYPKIEIEKTEIDQLLEITQVQLDCKAHTIKHWDEGVEFRIKKNKR